MADRTVCLKVDGWSNPRFARIEGNFVMFEAMWMGCDCPTCYARLDAIKTRMEGSEYSWRIAVAKIPEREFAPSAIVVVEPKEIPEKVDAFFSELLGLQISEVAEAIN